MDLSGGEDGMDAAGQGQEPPLQGSCQDHPVLSGEQLATRVQSGVGGRGQRSGGLHLRAVAADLQAESGGDSGASDSGGNTSLAGSQLSGVREDTKNPCSKRLSVCL